MIRIALDQDYADGEEVFTKHMMRWYPVFTADLAANDCHFLILAFIETTGCSAVTITITMLNGGDGWNTKYGHTIR